MQKNPLMMTPKETLKKYELVKAMNIIVKSLNDETGYYDYWVNIVPDEADDEDLMDIAYDEELLEDATNYFKTIMEEFINDGIFICGKLY